MKIIPLNQNEIVLVDDADFDFLNQWKWYCIRSCGSKYAVRNEPEVRGPIYMHRIIMSALPGQCVEHKNRNGLDNQRINLRFCTRSQNQANRARARHNTSGYKGVIHWKQRRKWLARSNQVHIGVFDNPVDAARAYDNWAVSHWGEFALTNKSLGLV